MKKYALLLFIAASFAAVYFWQGNQNELQTTPVITEETQLVIPAPGPAASQYPLPEPGHGGVTDQEVILPTLEESDEVIRTALYEIFDRQQLHSLFLLTGLVRHAVVIIDNLPGEKLPQRYMFTRKTAGKLSVKPGENDDYILAAQNYQRYSAFGDFISIVEIDKVVPLYLHYYPLFQLAYEELGYPDRYFNDRLIEVIDHLLTTPEVEGDIRLFRPNVFYRFADPELEALSAGQKILLRMGRDNARKISSKLSELRQRLTALVRRDRPSQ